jgi:alkaline phosphatase D
MHYRYTHDRALKGLQPLLRKGRHYAIWDDHDYGPNDSNKSLILEDESLTLFKRYWVNPSFGLPELPGVFTVVSYGDADLFLLDDRYYRDGDTMPDRADKAMFGPRQIAWLEDALLNSPATFKIIVAGGQMLNDFDVFEGWNHFPAERDSNLLPAYYEKILLLRTTTLRGDYQSILNIRIFLHYSPAQDYL